MDAAHFIWTAYLGFFWCLARFFIRTPAGRKRFNVLGALNATTHQIVSICCEGYIDAWSVIALLFEISKLGDGNPITLILDNAKYQRCLLVEETARLMEVELIFLPTYSPNLNLIERFWKFLKKKCLYSKYYASFDEFTGAIDKCVREAHLTHREELKSLLTHNFQVFNYLSNQAA